MCFIDQIFPGFSIEKMICCWNRSDKHRAKYGCFCIPWKLSSYLAASLSFVVQLALCIIFLGYKIYWAIIPLVFTVVFHFILFYGLMSRHSWMMRVYFGYSFLYSPALMGAFGWLLYVLITADHNPWYSQCMPKKDDNETCKKDARITAGWLCLAFFIAFVVNIFSRYILVKYQNYIQWKSRQTVTPTPTAQQPQAAGAPQVQSPTIYNVQVLGSPAQSARYHPTAPPESPTQVEVGNVPHWYPGTPQRSYKIHRESAPPMEQSHVAPYDSNAFGGSSVYNTRTVYPQVPSSSDAPPSYNYEMKKH